MGTPRILVVDDDAWILRMVSTVLEKRGYQISTASDGEEGLAAAAKETPDLVITDVMMPKVDGWTLVKRLRSRPEFAFVPVIFLTALGSDEDRIRGFRLGADDYLPKPFRFEELDLRVANALKRRALVEGMVRGKPEAEAAPKKAAVPGIHGTLDQLGVSSLLTVFEMERKSGVLILTTPAETGRVFFQNGRVLAARVDGKETPKNAEAVYHFLEWTTGKFEFSVLDVDMEDELQTTTTHLLIEGARRLDEAKAPR